MRFLTSVGILLLAICGLAAAGLVPHQHHGHHVSSYTVVSKHEEPTVKHEYSHKSWEEHQADGGHELAHFSHKFDHSDDAHEDYDGGHDHDEDYYAHPKYQYDYAVKDEKTGDSKKHWETRDGDKVKGSYTIKEADGTTRIVEYTADHKNGYNAVVKIIGHPHLEHESHEHSHYSH
ncbi:adult-specific cuticular protein ACP-22-like [Lucilia cuprina]|uniref:adult-specific cuticular protein ACP-22-like n=1 Tax=Lucilia cuprina TaxID=7375 RepID=UPI001F063E94|nr:adult-specific cuticular protein ACP-22-like [Lucilia cuprina]